MGLQDRDYMRGGDVPVKRRPMRPPAEPMLSRGGRRLVAHARSGHAVLFRKLRYHLGEPQGLSRLLPCLASFAACTAWICVYAPRDPSAVLAGRPSWAWLVAAAMAMLGTAALERCAWPLLSAASRHAGVCAGLVSPWLALSGTGAPSEPQLHVPGGEDDRGPLSLLEAQVHAASWMEFAAWITVAIVVLCAGAQAKLVSIQLAAFLSLLAACVLAAGKGAGVW